MDELEVSKIFGAGCAALLAFVGLGQLGKGVVSMDKLDEPAYIVEIPDSAGTEVAEVAKLPVGQLMAMAEMDLGAKVFKKCASCHKAEEGGANGLGPNLYGIVGRDIASVDGFSYSAALAEKGGQWDFAALDGFLYNPKEWAPGTKMAFKGLGKDADRASVIAWLNEQSAAPIAMPAVEEAAAEPEMEEAAVEAEPVQEEAAVEPAPEAEVAEAAPAQEEAAVEPAPEAEIAEAAPAQEETAVEPAPEAEVAEAAPAQEEAAVEPAPEAEVAEAAPVQEETAEAAPAAEEAPVVVAEAKTEEAAPAAPAAAAAATAVVASFMSGADADKGKKVFRKCRACHKADEGSANGVGPSLYGIVGRDIASVGDFKYSDALKGKGGKWDFEALNGFLENPKGWAPGTKMAYRGLRKEADRANLIAWLNQQSADPLPMPE